MKNTPIQNFLQDKETTAFSADEDKFFDYPISFQNENGELESGYIQDATDSAIDGDETKRELIVVVLRADKSRIFKFTKKCKWPIGCTPDWDTTHCYYNIEL